MQKNRLEAFSDGVLAIIITIMVLELKAPAGADLASLRPLLPVFSAYVRGGRVTITPTPPRPPSTGWCC